MVKKKQICAFLALSLLLSLLAGCNSADEAPPAPPANAPEHSSTVPAAPGETSPSTPQGDATSPLSLDFLPESTWLVITTSSPSNLSKNLGWKSILERVPMLPPTSKVRHAMELVPALLNPSLLEESGLDAQAPAGFAIADASQPGFLFFATNKSSKDAEKTALQSRIEAAFPEAKSRTSGAHTILDLDATDAFPLCPCLVVLSDEWAVALIHPSADVRAGWAETILVKETKERFTNRDDIGPLMNTLARRPGITAFVDLENLVDLEVQQILLGIEATYDHAVDSLERVQREGGKPDVIAHWEKQVQKEKEWLTENQDRRKAEAAFFQSVYGSISSITLGIDFATNDISARAHIRLKTGSILGSLFNNVDDASPAPLGDRDGTILASAGQIHWKSLFEIATLGNAAERTASQPVWAPDPALYAWLNALSDHSLEATLSHMDPPEKALNNPAGFRLNTRWSPIDATAMTSIIGLAKKLPEASAPTIDGQVHANIAGLQADIWEDNGGLSLRLQAQGTDTTGSAPSGSDAPPAGAKALLSKPNPAFRTLVKAHIFSWLLAGTVTKTAASPPSNTGNKAFLEELARKEEELSRLKRQSQDMEAAEIHGQVSAWGWTALHLQNTPDGWLIEGGQFLEKSTVQEQLPLLIEAVFIPRKKRPLDRQIRTLRREIRILRLRGAQPDGEGGEIRSIPTLPASP